MGDPPSGLAVVVEKPGGGGARVVVFFAALNRKRGIGQRRVRGHGLAVAILREPLHGLESQLHALRAGDLHARDMNGRVALEHGDHSGHGGSEGRGLIGAQEAEVQHLLRFLDGEVGAQRGVDQLEERAFLL